MPTYDYLCNTCGDKFEHFQTMSSPALKQRPECENDCNVKRIVSGGTGLIFKGSGFYLTDYGKKKSEKTGDSKPNTSTKKDKKKNNVSKNNTRKTSK